jgi:hypothetical protein
MLGRGVEGVSRETVGEILGCQDVKTLRQRTIDKGLVDFKISRF